MSVLKANTNGKIYSFSIAAITNYRKWSGLTQFLKILQTGSPTGSHQDKSKALAFLKSVGEYRFLCLFPASRGFLHFLVHGLPSSMFKVSNRLSPHVTSLRFICCLPLPLLRTHVIKSRSTQVNHDNLLSSNFAPLIVPAKSPLPYVT